jgi:hypothetical protein
MRRFLLIAMAVALGGAAPAHAAPAIAEGTRIRVNLAGGRHIVGRLTSIDETSVTMFPEVGPARARQFQLASIEGIDVTDGRSRGKAILIGAAIGAGAGALLGMATGSQDGMVGGRGLGAAGGALTFVLPGIVVGAVVRRRNAGRASTALARTRPWRRPTGAVRPSRSRFRSRPARPVPSEPGVGRRGGLERAVEHRASRAHSSRLAAVADGAGDPDPDTGCQGQHRERRRRRGRSPRRAPRRGQSKTSSVVVSRDFAAAMSRAKGMSPGLSYFAR